MQIERLGNKYFKWPNDIDCEWTDYANSVYPGMTREGRQTYVHCPPSEHTGIIISIFEWINLLKILVSKSINADVEM